MFANVKNKSSMELENKIKCVLMDFEINEITLQEATKQILLLLNVVGRSEQLVCPECSSEDPDYSRGEYHCRCCGYDWAN